MTINDLGGLLQALIFPWTVALLLRCASRMRQLIGWGVLVAGSILLTLNYLNVQGILTTRAFQNGQLLLGAALVFYVLALLYVFTFKGKL